ncbi:ABC transporter ATP-binding protein [Paenibacillus thiaminolyticus]|uniref:ABC transporter ATP-binding protein n=1 Tax=Paenibacillus thiaminolyticus TaxID=49283 RepID=A0AAP9DSD3_PANTH|nr:ABC transporter ATP-binding protein [Paenibacillus thiaminolyticus]MCY9536603.1 ABC transporter ATP-binding protein [Paenibacillus thiaminolyticus]MCY9601496.1 ABC transporter ATP-binding protein [Paenibacillus thiaminolyticus]MCY9608920.1 ABC transporter ATP-binding protein [Paenibacillus thiaminolyticus]MCY9612121.1 ABC transporter ATP-binding protein [Paenibacillus thiaminolyticus]MCY9619556.1 ABC transporter ATP-binding protein [Paenibacillus thiaminolyticus]
MLEVRNVSKVYEGKQSYQALTNLNLKVNTGEFVGVMGPSGSGKTTLMNVVSTIDKPTSGEVYVGNEQMNKLSKRKLALFRRRELGFVFQDFNLLQTLTVKENIIFPLALDGIGIKEQDARVHAIAEKLGITSILNKRTYEISGGQCQRTAIARAVIHQPRLILADEPTGNLDSKSAQDVLQTLERLNKEEGVTMMMVTHDAQAASYCDRVIFIKDGTLYQELHKTGSRQIFFQGIMEILSSIGGTQDEYSPVRA